MKYEIQFSRTDLPQVSLGSYPDDITVIHVSKFQSLPRACFDLGVISQDRDDRRVLLEMLIAFYLREKL